MSWRSAHPAFREHVAALHRLHRRGAREATPSDIEGWLRLAENVLDEPTVAELLESLDLSGEEGSPKDAQALRRTADALAGALADLAERSRRAFARGIGWIDAELSDCLERVAKESRELARLLGKHPSMGGAGRLRP